MMPITAEQREQMLENGRNVSNDGEPKPVVKLFTPDGSGTWLLTELDPEEPDLGFGLCDLGFGTPELGYVSISELQSVRGRLGLPIERDRHFTADKSIGAYAQEAFRHRRIVA